MNKSEYMKLLKKQLHRLPKEDFEKAVEYFEEYFADAGNEQSAIADLGNPQEAADQIIRELAVKNGRKPVQGVKKDLSAVWVGILALCAAPFALPLVLTVVILVIAILLMVLALICSFITLGAAMMIAAPVSIVAGFTVITQSIPVFISCLGLGFMMEGLGILITYGMIILCRKFLHGTVQMFGRIARRGGR